MGFVYLYESDLLNSATIDSEGQIPLENKEHIAQKVIESLASAFEIISMVEGSKGT